MFSLKGKIAVVTGGTGHLGIPISEGLAEFGANLVVASRNLKKCEKHASKLSQEYGIQAIGIELDVRSSESVTYCMNTVHSEFGSIDILVNNAAFGKANISIESVSEKDWIGGIDGTLNGVFRCSKAVIPFMRAKRYGVLINISSMYGIVSPDGRIYGNSGYNNPPDYGAGKAAVIQFTKYSACHLAKEGIRVNAISPGPFPNRHVQQNKSFISRLKKRVPLGRIGEPKELKGAVVFLASSASSYVTGQNIIVDGGWTAW
jgi:gluconate 5-dehydrogenase